MEVAEVAGKALEMLSSPSKWTKSGYHSDNGRVCLGTALYLAEGNEWTPRVRYHPFQIWARISPAVLEAVQKVIREQHPELFASERPLKYPIMYFNDHDKTHLTDVQRVLEKVRAA